MTNKFKTLRKIGILFLFVNLSLTSCDKEETSESIEQNIFNAPKALSAKQFFDKSSSLNSNKLGKSNSTSKSVIDWESSSEKNYKNTPEAIVDILYTPIYLRTNGDAKAFLASTELNGVVDSRKVYILYKSNDISSGLSAYIFIYGLDGILQQVYNFENGVELPLPENNNSSLQSKGECEGNIANMTDEEFDHWLANCFGGIRDGEVVVTDPALSNEGGTYGGSTSALDDFNFWSGVSIPPVDTNSNSSNYGQAGSNGRDIWYSPNTIIPKGAAIANALDLEFNTAEALWLIEQDIANQKLLDIVAEFLNDNKERPNNNELDVEGVDNNQMQNVNPEAIELITQVIGILKNNPDSNTEEGRTAGIILTNTLINDLLEEPFSEEFMNEVYCCGPTLITDPTIGIKYYNYVKTQIAIIKSEYPPNYKFSKWELAKIYMEANVDALQIGLDIIGLIPSFGEVADLANGVIYTIRGDGVNATLSFAATLPIGGWAATGTKWALKASSIGTRVRLTWRILSDGTVYFGSSGNKLRQVLGLTDSAFQAHHIIPWAQRNHPAIQKAALSGNAFHINEAINGVPIHIDFHNGRHTNYTNRIIQRLDDIDLNQSIDDIYNDVTDIINDVNSAIRNNQRTHINQLIF